MGFLHDVAQTVAVLCRAQVDELCVDLRATLDRLHRITLSLGCLVVAFCLFLGGLGLMVAALFIGLTPYLGAHWAAMIAAAASFLGSGILMGIAICLRKYR